jgi:alcohol dehydrogenase YqhD (iron-dependent ADH family)
MQAFTFHFPTKIIFGSGKLAEAGNEAKALGQKPLLLTTRTAMQKNGALKKLTGLLASRGVSPVIFEGIEPNPHVETLDKAVALGLKERCDFVMALGGGSVMDASKAVAAALGDAQDGVAPSVFEYTNGMMGQNRKVQKPFKLMIISGTAATGSEGNCAAVLTKASTHEKVVLWDLGAFPTTTILDPELHLSLSLEATRDGAVDIMLHVLEQTFTGDAKAPLQDRVAEGMVLGVMECLEAAEKNLQDLTARENLAWASVSALIAGGGPNFGRSGPWVIHPLEHPLSGHTDCSHGHGLAALWAPVLRAMAPRVEAKIARFGQACLGLPKGDSSAEKTLTALERYLADHSMAFKISQFGATAETCRLMAADAARIYGGGRGVVAAPVVIDQKKAEQIYLSAL